MILKTLKTALIVASLGLVLGASANAATINLVSGSGGVGNPDGAVKYLAASTTGPIVPASFDTTTYVAAQVVTPNSNWVSAATFNSTVGGGSAALWDAPTQAAPTSLYPTSGTYAINFGTAAGFGYQSSATLSGFYSVDDYISAIYVNGTLVTGSDLSGGSASFLTVNALPTFNILPYLKSGVQNTIYVVADNLTASPTGLIFNFNVTTAVPEPSSIAMVGIAGLMGVGALVRRKRSIA